MYIHVPVHCCTFTLVLTLACSHVSLEHEIACVDVRSLDGSAGTSHLCAVGTWTDISARVLRLPSLDTLHVQPLMGGECTIIHCFLEIFFRGGGGGGQTNILRNRGGVGYS